MSTRRVLCAVMTALAATTACDQQGAYGDVNSIVAVARPALWAEVEDSVYAALEPTIWTVRNEKTFTVTYQDPAHERWSDIRRFTQMLLIGPASAPWIGQALAVAGRENASAPAVIQAFDVWARGQLVTVLLTPEADQAEAVLDRLGELSALYDRQYRDWAVNRMFVSGRDSTLADTIADVGGFRLLVPNVYQWARRDSVFLFRNDNPDPSELIRQVMVTWMSPIPQGMEGEDLLAWRADVAAGYYEYPQITDLSNAQAGPIDHRGLDGYRIQAVWQNPPEANWPAAGPFILTAVLCPAQDRLYLLDSWLYAPGREKFEYMIQLETIADSFRCEG
jgi:Domain of unknown function (DUF4837)